MKIDISWWTVHKGPWKVGSQSQAICLHCGKPGNIFDKECKPIDPDGKNAKEAQLFDASEPRKV